VAISFPTKENSDASRRAKLCKDVFFLRMKDRNRFRLPANVGRSVRSFADARRSCEQPNPSELEKHHLGHYRFLI